MRHETSVLGGNYVDFGTPYRWLDVHGMEGTPHVQELLLAPAATAVG
jgi:hypothetical protein